MNLRIVIIKVSYKFLLHEYSLGNYQEFLKNYQKLEKILLNYQAMLRYDYIKRMMNTLRTLEEKGKLEKFDSRYVISDLEGLLKNSDNYIRKRDLLIKKIMSIGAAGLTNENEY